MGAMQATNSRKQQLRAVRAQNPRAIQDAPASAAVVAVANPCAGQNVTAWRTCFDRVHAKLVGVPMGSVEKAEIDQQVGALKQDLDSMSEMGEMESLRLQMAMDRMSKMMSTLSNVMKKASDTSSTIIQNIK
jgi:hypothetical protein